MSVWLVRAGKHGEQEEFALEKSVAVIGWDELPNLSSIESREMLADTMQKTYPDRAKMALANFVGQVWAFRARIETGDLIILPLKTQSMIAIGKCKGPYEYKSGNPEGARHFRTVEWIRDAIPREAFGKDLLYSFGAFMTVCQIKRNNAEERIQAIVHGKSDPLAPASGPEPEVPADETSVPDLDEYAADQIRRFIAQKFRGHELSRLVGQVLRAEGYQTHVSPPGPDGGVDILAGKGLMGFDTPRLCVQVKSGNAPVDVKVFRELRGVMEDRGAEQGLLVSWSGFTRAAIDEARRQFFRIRLWDSGALVAKILENYEKLDDELRAELPLKRIWALVLEEE